MKQDKMKQLERQVAYQSMVMNRLAVLLKHAVELADGWHDECWGGIIEDDPLMDEARQIVCVNDSTQKIVVAS